MRFLKKRRGASLIAAVIVAAAILASIVSAGGATNRDAKAGVTTIELTGQPVRGAEHVDLQELRGHIVLLSFLNFLSQTSSHGDESLPQATFLRSMEAQHRRFGLRTIIVDGTDVANAGHLSRGDLLNWTYNWSIAPPIMVLPDENSAVAHRFGVTHTPTTFLIDRNGKIVKRWNTFAMAATLDFAIRALEGRRPGQG